MIDVTLNSAGEIVLTDEVMLATEAPRRSGVATRGADMNPAAAGGVCIVTTCTDCGSVQRTNSNGRHEEIGPWWITDAKWLLDGSPHTSAVADALFARELEGELARRGLRDAR